MKSEQVLELINAIPPDLIEEADVQSPAKRRLPRIARVGLIAACLCLALIGTVTAARFLGVQIQEEDEDGVTWLSGGIAYYPVDNLSEEVQALDSSYYDARKFNSWDEVEEFIGVNLMDNPVLDASPAKNFHTGWKDSVHNINGDFLVVGSANLTSILTFGCYEIGDVDILLRGFLFTDRMEKGRGEDWDQRFLGFHFSEYTKTGRESYTSPNGLEAQLLRIEYGWKQKTCLATFSLSGVPFIVKANSDHSLEEAHTALIQILDGFVLS